MTKLVQLFAIFAILSVISAEYCFTTIDEDLGFGSINSDESNCGLTFKVKGTITAFKADHSSGFNINMVNNNTIVAKRGSGGRSAYVSFVWKTEMDN